MKITIEHEISARRIADMMVTAIEGGVTYWCKEISLIDGIIPTKSPWYDDEKLYEDPVFDDRGMLPPKLMIKVVTTEDETTFLTLDAMKRGFELMMTFGSPKGWCWNYFIDENEDAIVADVWLQLSVYGKVVYG